MPELLKDRVRMVGFLHPKEGVSYEDFSDYWLNSHGETVMSLKVVQKNILKYEQFHFDPVVNDQLAAQGVHKLPYYGMGIFEAESYAKLMEIFTDVEYLERVVANEEKFFDRTLTEVTAGSYAVFIDKKEVS